MSAVHNEWINKIANKVKEPMQRVCFGRTLNALVNFDISQSRAHVECRNCQYFQNLRNNTTGNNELMTTPEFDNKGFCPEYKVR